MLFINMCRFNLKFMYEKYEDLEKSFEYDFFNNRFFSNNVIMNSSLLDDFSIKPFMNQLDGSDNENGQEIVNENEMAVMRIMTMKS